METGEEPQEAGREREARRWTKADEERIEVGLGLRKNYREEEEKKRGGLRMEETEVGGRIQRPIDGVLLVLLI